MNLYPAIDIKGGECVRLLYGDMDAVTRYNPDPGDQARRFVAAGCGGSMLLISMVLLAARR